MDPIKNPFSPGAGAPPPELVGRDGVLEQARVLLGRVKAKRAEKSMLLTGLRGVGKTVLQGTKCAGPFASDLAPSEPEISRTRFV